MPRKRRQDFACEVADVAGLVGIPGDVLDVGAEVIGVSFADGVGGGDEGVAFHHHKCGTPHGGLGEGTAAVGLLPVEHVGEVEGSALRKIRGEDVSNFGGIWPHRVVGADVLADIAAIDPVGDLGPPFSFDGGSAFDGEIGDAARGVDGVGGDGLRGTGVDAAGARAAAVGLGDLVGGGFEVEGGEDAAEEEGGAEARVDEEGVFSDPAQAGAGGEFAFRDGGGVDEGGELVARVLLAECVADGMQAVFDDFVVVASLGVTGDSAVAGDGGIGVASEGVLVGDDDDGARAGEPTRGVEARVGEIGEVVHFAVFVGGEPVAELVGPVGGIGAADAGEGEAVLAAEGEDDVGELDWRGVHLDNVWVVACCDSVSMTMASA